MITSEHRTPTTAAATAPRKARRDTYADVGLAVRYSRSQLDTARPSALTRRVWEAVAVDLLASWSRLTESRQHLTRDVCRLVGIDPTSAGNRSKVGAALRELHRADALSYRPAAGTQRSVVALPKPPDEWEDPTCGLTAGDLRGTTAEDGESPSTQVRGVTQQVGEGESPSTQVTRGEDVGEDAYEDDTPKTLEPDGSTSAGSPADPPADAYDQAVQGIHQANGDKRAERRALLNYLQRLTSTDQLSRNATGTLACLHRSEGAHAAAGYLLAAQGAGLEDDDPPYSVVRYALACAGNAEAVAP